MSWETKEQRVQQRFWLFSQLLGMLVMLVGSLVLLGWWSGQSWLTFTLPGLVTMKTNTAAGFIVAGSVLWLWSRQPLQRWKLGYVRGGALLVAGLGILTLNEVLFQVNLGIDQWLLHEPVPTGNVFRPGQMAPVSAVNFSMMGITLFLMTFPHWITHQIARWLTYLVLTLSFVTLVGYLYHAPILYQSSNVLIAMALPTAACFFLLSLGILCHFPQESLIGMFFSDNLGGHLGRRLIPAVMVTIFVLDGLIEVAIQQELIGHDFDRTYLATLITMIVVILTEQVANSLNRLETQRQEGEYKVAKFNRLYATISQINQAIVRAKDRETLFHDICRIVVEESSFRMVAWIGMVDKATQRIVPTAKYGVEDSYLETLKTFLNDNSVTCNPTQQAVRQGQQIICRSFENSSPKDSWQTQARQRGYQTAAAFPIYVYQELAGVMTLYATEADFFDEVEINSLKQVIDNISYALEQGKEAGMKQLVQEIAERKRVEEALRESEERYRFLVANLPNIAVLLFDHELRFVLVGGEEMAKNYFEPAQMEGKFLTEAFTPEIVKQFEPLCQKALLGEATVFEMSYGGFYYSHHILPVRSAKGEIYLGMVMSRNITERKQSEANLQEAKDKAEAANRAKSAFLANMSHELRTPLNGILGFAQILLRDDNLTQDQKDKVAVIQRSGEYLLTMITDILDLSKIEANRMELHPSAFYFDSFLAGIVELFEMRAQQKGIVFHYERLSTLPKAICADEKRLRQILINLLGNAVKFTERGGVCLKVGYQNSDADWIRFQVEDTGVGIAPADMEKIFSPFQQAGDKSYQAQGTGLGLAITKKLVDMMGGEIHLESVPQQGSKFWVLLKLPEAHEVPTTEPVEQAVIIGYHRSIIPPYRSEKVKILVVDDHWENRAVVTKLLAPLGFELTEAANGREAIEIAYQWCPEVVIMDLVMPVMDGFTATRLLRKTPELKNVIIIALSASVFDFHQQESTQAGCDDFIAKPFRLETLLACLQRHLQLTWVYEQPKMVPHSATPPATSATPAAATEEVMVPSTAELTRLSQLAKKGDIQGILDMLEELEKSDQKLVSFTSQVRKLAKGFQRKKIFELIQRYLGQ